MKRVKWLVVVIMMMLLAVVSQAEISTSILTNRETDCLEGRVEFTYDKDWQVGILGKYFEEAQEPHQDWGIGLYAKLAVDPNATIPLANWFPAVGEWINLPDTLTAKTYLIGKGELYPCVKDKDIDIVGSIGAGGEIGPVIFEYLYMIIEGGDSDNPMLDSGPVFYIGLKPIRWK